MSEIAKILSDIKEFYFKEAPYYKKLTFKPFTLKNIESFEKKIGFNLGEELKEFLMVCDFRLDFNGAFSYEDKNTVLMNWKVSDDLIKSKTFEGWKERMIKNGFNNWKEELIGPFYCSNKWIPIACDGCGNLICIDYDPGKNGVIGQVINMEFQDGQGPYFCETTLVKYLKKQYQYLINGKWTKWEYGEEGNELIEIDGYM